MVPTTLMTTPAATLFQLELSIFLLGGLVYLQFRVYVYILYMRIQPMVD